MGRLIFRLVAAWAIALVIPQAAHAEWKLREEYEDKALRVISISAESQEMPVGQRDMGTATMAFTCLPADNSLFVQLIWPERMTFGSKIAVKVAEMDEKVEMPFEFEATPADNLQSFTLDGSTVLGTMFVGRFWATKESFALLTPDGVGRVQAAKFDLTNFGPKLREVMNACPKYSYLDKNNLKK